MSKIVELRPDPVLIDNSFEGYKLNLQSLPSWFKDLTVPVDRLFPAEDQYSFVHAKLFGLHNHLVCDNWDNGFNYYYVDKNQQVRRISFDSSTYTFDFTVVYDVPAHVNRTSGHFNLCLNFPSNKLAVVSDGTGYLHIVSTGTRNSNQNSHWKTLQSFLVLDGEFFTLLDSRIQERGESLSVHVLCQSIEHISDSFYSILTWVAYENEGDTWRMKSMKKLKGKGTVHYAAIETTFEAVYVASDNPFKYVLDTEREIVDETLKVESRKIIYTWQQTSEDITITIQLAENYDKNLLNIDVKSQNLKVTYDGKVFVEGRLKDVVDADLTTWNVQDSGRVDILITKSGSDNWVELIEGGDTNGEQILDPALVEEIHRRLAHLCSDTEVTSQEQSMPGLSGDQLEECDVVTEENSVLARLDAHSHSCTHAVSLVNNGLLFSVAGSPRQVPAVALRHHVDACLWQPTARTDEWTFQHCATLHAFGYIQSSKTNRKFLTSAPNGSYSVVCEMSRHLFVYQPKGQNGVLRHRGAGRNVKVGQQYVFNVDRYGEVLGIHASECFLFVLTTTAFLAIEVM